jgi:hypothetical protein
MSAKYEQTQNGDSQTQENKPADHGNNLHFSKVHNAKCMMQNGEH